MDALREHEDARIAGRLEAGSRVMTALRVADDEQARAIAIARARRQGPVRCRRTRRDAHGARLKRFRSRRALRESTHCFRHAVLNTPRKRHVCDDSVHDRHPEASARADVIGVPERVALRPTATFLCAARALDVAFFLLSRSTREDYTSRVA